MLTVLLVPKTNGQFDRRSGQTSGAIEKVYHHEKLEVRVEAGSYFLFMNTTWT
jgi:hypothetical protein